MRNWESEGLYIYENGVQIAKFQKEASFSNPESAKNATLAAASPDLKRVCDALLVWSITPETEPCGDFSWLAENII